MRSDARPLRGARPPGVLVVRRPLDARHADPRRFVRAVRGLLIRRVLVLGVVLVVACLGRVWLSHQIMAVGYELSTAREMLARLEHERQALEIELATLRDVRRLNELARTRLHLVEPGRGQVVELP